MMGYAGMVASGHALASLAGVQLLHRGGNAVDAGVAVGLCLNVVQSDFTNLGGVAPCMIYTAEDEAVTTISGLGTWPHGASIAQCRERGGLTEDQFTCSVVPAALDAWITALDRFGTRSFTDVAQTAIDLARHGFAAYPLFIMDLARRVSLNDPYTRSVYYPSGAPPAVGERIVQPDLARTLTRLTDVEARNWHLGRHGALMAVRAEFYEGAIAEEFVGYLQSEGGVMTMDDVAAFHVDLDAPVRTMYRDVEVCSCGPWCQGPVNNLALNILEGYDPGELDHNGAAYIHRVASVLDLAFADRERYFGDPRFVDVPIATLTSKAYAATRRQQIAPDRAEGAMPPPGDLGRDAPGSSARPSGKSLRGGSPPDTSYGCVVDGAGNAFSCTPSDFGRLIPGLGITVSPRGRQSWLDPTHPSSLEPGKRPRLTPNPALALQDGALFMVYGTPGGDSQPQTMVQFLLNVVDHAMDVQAAIEAPRFRSENFPNSFWPHAYLPGRLNVEARVPPVVRARLAAMGHDVQAYPAWTWLCGGACAILVDRAHGVLKGGADPRRACYALGY
jgi:gamma-glutamyltranspeptidase/glutathione hydrolase